MPVSLNRKHQIILYAVKYNANHAASRFKVSANSVRRWLRQYGLESKINSYYRKY